MFTCPITFFGVASESTPVLSNTLGLDAAESQRARLTDSTDFNFGTQYTFLVWVYPTDLSADNGIYNQRGSGLNYAQFSILSTGKMHFEAAYGGTTSIDIQSDVTLSENNLYMIGFEVTGSSVDFIINGGYDTNNGSFSVSPTDLMADLDLGRVSDGTDSFYFTGGFSIPMAFQESLNPVTVSTIYNSGTAKQPECYDSSITDLYAFAIPLNDGVTSGQELVDVSGNGNDAFLFGSPTPVYDGEPQEIIACAAVSANYNTLLLDGVNQQVQIAKSSSMVFGSSDFGVVVKFKTSNSAQQYIFQSSLNTGTATQNAITIRKIATGAVRAEAYIGSSSINIISSATDFDDDVWHTLIFNRVGSNFELLVDDSSVGTDSLAGTINETGADWRFGASWNGASSANFFDGSISLGMISIGSSFASSDFVGEAKQPWQYPSNVTDDLVIALPLNNGVATGRENEDFSGYENDGTLINSPTYTGDDLEFTGDNLIYDTFGYSTGKYVNIPAGASLTGFTALSYSVWINPDSVTSTVGIITHEKSGTSNNSEVNLVLRSDGKIRFQIGSTQPASASILSIDTWYHIAFTWDGSNMKLYINGVEDATATSAISSIAAGFNTFNIGRRDQSVFYFPGGITKPLVFPRELTASEVLILANKNLPLDSTLLPSSITDDLHVGYTMNSNDDTLTDLSVNGWDGVAIGGIAADDAEIDWQDAVPPGETFNILTESGDELTTESGDNLILE